MINKITNQDIEKAKLRATLDLEMNISSGILEIIEGVPKYYKQEGLKQIEKNLDILLEEKKGNIIVLVAGGSASGKTSEVADKIAKFNKGESVVISMDNYYRGTTFMEEQKAAGNKLNFDQPEALNLDLFYEHLEKLQSGKTIYTPYRDFNTEPVFDEIEIKPKKIIVVEGLFALDNKLKKLGDIKVFTDIGAHGRLLRRIFRDVVHRGKPAHEIMKQFLAEVEPMQAEYIDPTKQNADLIISNEYDPHVEAINSGATELKGKFEIANLNSHEIGAIINAMGGDYVGKTQQKDYFFDAYDRDFSQTDEIVRIREEKGKSRYMFTYKGPKKEVKHLERNKLNFFVDKDMLDSFNTIYKRHKRIVEKTRSSYYLDGVLISIDKVEGKRFIQFRKYDENNKVISALIKNLGLKKKEILGKTYYDVVGELYEEEKESLKIKKEKQLELNTKDSIDYFKMIDKWKEELKGNQMLRLDRLTDHYLGMLDKIGKTKLDILYNLVEAGKPLESSEIAKKISGPAKRVSSSYVAATINGDLGIIVKSVWLK